MSGEPTPSPTGNLLAVLKLGSRVLRSAWQDILSYGAFILFRVEGGGRGSTVKLWFCTLPYPTDAELSLQGEFQLMWCCVEAQFSFAGSCILSYHYAEKFTKKKSACSTDNWVRGRQPRTVFAIRQHRCGVGGFAQCSFWSKSWHILWHLRPWRAMPGLEKPRAFVGEES